MTFGFGSQTKREARCNVLASLLIVETIGNLRSGQQTVERQIFLEYVSLVFQLWLFQFVESSLGCETQTIVSSILLVFCRLSEQI